MPEGPEVRIFADCLSTLIGYNIQDIQYSDDCDDKFFVFEIGDKLIDLYSYGKKLLFKLLRQGEEYHLSNSVLMSGRWSFLEQDKYRFKIVFINDEGESVNIWYCDTRNMSLFKFGSEEELLANVGHDWLHGIEYDTFYELITRKRIKHMEICKFLMEPKYTSGIGNYLKAEILFEARLHPQQQIGKLTDDIIEHLYDIIVEKIYESYKSGGLTIKTYYDPFGRLGTFQTKVYGKDTINFFGRKYNVIKDEFSDKRTTHYVPELQMIF